MKHVNDQHRLHIITYKAGRLQSNHVHALENGLYLLFVQNLHGMILFADFVLNQHNATERSCSERLDAVEVIQTCSILRHIIS